jgi:hypothetical protein
MLLHLWLAWWLAFSITGAATVSAGILIKLVMGKEKTFIK